jgi:3-phosphoshikimate 1-carboxyvinyltransferase
MVDSLEIRPVTIPLCGTIRPPGSKSLTNRALIVAALAKGPSLLTGVLDSQDTRVMLDSLRRLGLAVSHDTARDTVSIVGCGGVIPASASELWLENSGTSIRFLTALCTLGNGRFQLDGNPRMRERPIGELASALNQLGADVRCELDNACPPIVVTAHGLPGGTARVGGNISSQYLSALLMAAPAANGPVTIEVEGTLVSEPYVDMTLAVMKAFGVSVDSPRPGVYHLSPQHYRGGDYDIEPDASAASYFFAAAAITGGEVTVSGLTRSALQGDVAFVDALAQMGCTVDSGAGEITVRGGKLHGIDIDMNAISDTAQTLSAVAPFATGPTRIRNVAHIRHKETDRIAAVATELRRIGQTVEEHADGLTIHPAPLCPATIATYDDHRMAMSFALVGLRTPGIRIAHPECTAKTYPRFFEDLETLCGGRPDAPRA